VLKNKKIVVTGGAGFIGGNLVHALANDNEVSVIDDLSTGHLENIQDLIDSKNIEFIYGSITDLSILQKTFNDVDYVFHEAAIPSVPRSIKDPLRSHTINCSGTLNVLLAAKEHQIKKVVYASSSSIYGDTPTLPKKEEMTPCPLSPYAVSKLAGEYYGQVFSTVYNLPVVSLRYFNVYGPCQNPLSEYAAVIPKFISRVLNDKPPVIYGDGKQTRDFTFIDDVVRANMLAAKGKVTGIFNIAGGKRTTITELAHDVINILEKDLEPVYDNPRPGDIKHSLADISKANAKFGYVPKFGIRSGLKETISWF